MALTTPQNLIGKHVYIVGDHPWAGDSGYIVDYDAGIAMFKVRIRCADAMDGHECFADIEHLRHDRRGRE